MKYFLIILIFVNTLLYSNNNPELDSFYWDGIFKPEDEAVITDLNDQIYHLRTVWFFYKKNIIDDTYTISYIHCSLNFDVNLSEEVFNSIDKNLLNGQITLNMCLLEYDKSINDIDYLNAIDFVNAQKNKPDVNPTANEFEKLVELDENDSIYYKKLPEDKYQFYTLKSEHLLQINREFDNKDNLPPFLFLIRAPENFSYMDLNAVNNYVNKKSEIYAIPFSEFNPNIPDDVNLNYPLYLQILNDLNNIQLKDYYPLTSDESKNKLNKEFDNLIPNLEVLAVSEYK